MYCVAFCLMYMYMYVRVFVFLWTYKMSVLLFCYLFIPSGLPTTRLSTFLENRVNSFLRNVGSNAGEVTIRVVSASDKVLETRPGMSVYAL